ncbi:hypothetical protein [Flavobacterium reichenbachii]|uniref:Cell wall anchor protein n=1 Tax=Flavobacterium reichenbachii TaxID=362418 RepID=A0A085ZPU0_9FLAO|nr:hypothetical protein [Flavobacterium reichenbachii]KFF06454.1 hypothetical protein IW19_13445 [Flavobacterium reichenbachii]OXB11871.1 hypothetical protein B0A68_20435 [Flavobacterium reichenbachii]
MLNIIKFYRMLIVCILFLSTFSGHAQIGIGTVTPSASSALDITSTTQGLLTPRMTTAQKNAIVTPADGLMVYDTDLKLFYYYSTGTSTWNPLNSTSSGRLNFKRIKSTDVLATVLAAELAVGGNTKYVLNTNTLYEINGTVAFNLPIDLNNAYVTGLDANEDVISSAGTIFEGATGGSVRFLTLRGARAFNVTGPGAGTSTSLLVQNVIVDGNNSGTVGTISGFGLYFGNVVQFIRNTNGLQYSNIGNLLLNSQAWSITNAGTFETFFGTFGLIQKNSGYSTVDSSDIALDVSGTLGTLTVGTGVLLGTVFSGTSSNPYVRGYTASATYPGYNFSTAWTVDSPGIPREGDSDATGDINLDAAVGSGVSTAFTGTGTSSRIKLNGTTTSSSLFRFTRDGNNRITYRGNKTRYFQVTASVSYQGTATDLTLILYFARNGVVLTDTKVYGRPTSGFLSSGGILALPIVGTIQLKKDDYIEIWGERYDGTGNISTVSLNLTAK